MARPSSSRLKTAVGRREGIKSARSTAKTAVQRARASGGSRADIRGIRQAGQRGIAAARAVPGAGLGRFSLGQIRGMQAPPQMRPNFPMGVGAGFAQQALGGMGGGYGQQLGGGPAGAAMQGFRGAFGAGGGMQKPAFGGQLPQGGFGQQLMGGANMLNRPMQQPQLPRAMAGAGNSGYFNSGAYGGNYGGTSPMAGRPNMEPGGFGTPAMGSARAVPGAVGY